MRFLDDYHARKFIEHCEQEHDARHDTECKKCNALWARIRFDFTNHSGPERPVAREAQGAVA